MLGDMDVNHVSIEPHSQEENGTTERFGGKIMNAVLTARYTAGKGWQHWAWTLADATDKYNQLPHSSTNDYPPTREMVQPLRP